MAMNGTQYTAGLVFLDRSHLDSMHLSQCFRNVLIQNGIEIRAIECVSAQQIRIVTDQVVLNIAKRAEPFQSHNPPQAPHAPQAAASEDILKRACVIATLTLGAEPTAALSSREKEKRADQTRLAKLCYQMAQQARPEYIQWLLPDTLLECDDFLSAADKILPRRMRKACKSSMRATQPATPVQTDGPRSPAAQASGDDAPHILAAMEFQPGAAVDQPDQMGAKPFPDIENTSQELAYEYERRNISRRKFGQRAKLNMWRQGIASRASALTLSKMSRADRLTSWVLSFAIALFSLPVGLALALVNLIRGEDLRLTAHTLALTGLGVTLNASGAMAEAFKIIAG